MNITTGSPVSGEDFFDRKETLKHVWDTLSTDSVLLAAPRRVGKTSLMQKLYEEPQNGFDVLLIDGQFYATPEDLVAELAVISGELRADSRYFFRKWAGENAHEVEKMELWELKSVFRKVVQGRWSSAATEILSDLVMDGAKVLIVIDELPILLHNLMSRSRNGFEQSQDILEWLRHVRQEPTLRPHVRQVLGGSIGLPRIASALGCSNRICDLCTIDVGPFDRETAKALATALLASRQVSLSEATMDAFLDQIETFLPLFIQIMASAVAAESQRRNQPVDADLIRECYEQRALGSQFRSQFEEYYERLDRYYSPQEARIARIILRELAISRGPLSKSHLLGIYQKELGPVANPEEFDLFLTWLRDDFYLADDGANTISFKSRWLRDWWREHHAS